MRIMHAGFKRLCVFSVVVLAMSVTGHAGGQTAYFSLTGDLTAAGDQVDVHFDLSKDVSSADELLFRTFTYSGGTNAAGDAIIASAFDSDLWLYDSLGNPRGQNDRISATDLDAELTWAGVQALGTPLNPDPLPADNYRLSFSERGDDGTGPWALDLIGPGDALAIQHVSLTGTSDIDTLKFGTTGAGTNAATYNHSTGSLNLEGPLVIARTGIAAFNLTGGSVTNSLGYIGWEAGSKGAANVTGTGSTWINTSSLYVGRLGTGTLTTGSGGTVLVGDLAQAGGEAGSLIVSDASSNTAFGGLLVVQNDSTLNHSGVAILGDEDNEYGTATVTGAGSTWNNSGILYVGNFGSGTLNIEGGGAVMTDTFCYIGWESGSTGKATVTGPGSVWHNTSNLSIGWDGNGTLNVENGGRVTNAIGRISADTGSTGAVTVTGINSAWNNWGALYVGDATYGTLTVEDGGAVTNTEGYIGYGSASTGTVIVTGAGSTWHNSGTLSVGRHGNGTLNVRNRGEVSSVGGTIGVSTNSIGTVTVAGAGSTWTNSGDLQVGSTSNGTLNVEAGGAVSNRTGYIGYWANSIGTVTVAGAGSTWTNSGDLRVGSAGIGALTIEAGGRVTNKTGYIGYDAGSIGTVTVTGGDSRWTISNGLAVGNDGTGTLTIEDGALVSLPTYYSVSIGQGAGSTGHVTVTGAGSKLTNVTSNLYVGRYGNGTLTIADGGQVFNKTGNIGNAVDSIGTVTVTGHGSAWYNGDWLFVGDPGQGTLTIADGGQVTSPNGLIGNTAGSVGIATVTGVGSTWTSSQLRVGGSSTGTLQIEAGGNVSSSIGRVGSAYGSIGTVTVTDTGSAWVNETSLYVGNYGDGSLSVEAGAQVSDETGYIGYGPNSSGAAIVTGPGSSWTHAAGLYVGGSESEPGGTATLNVLDGGRVEVTGPLKIWAPGTVQGDGSITAPSVLNSGTVAPGNSTGILTLTGNYTQDSNGSLAIEVAGDGGVPGVDFDVLEVSGEVTLAGSLRLILLNTGYLPEIGDTVAILTTGSLVGAFDGLMSHVISGDRGFSVSYPDGHNAVLEVTAMSPLVGDLNGDGFVGVDDLNAVLGHWNESVTAGAWPLGDSSGDGFVGIEDLNNVLGNWNAGTPPAAAANAAIPEPASVLLLMSSGVLLGTRKHRR